MNTVSLIGRLTADPQSHAGTQHESTSFRLAVPRGVNSETADFVDIVTFDAVAKTVADYLVKGRRVAVIGRLRQNTWTTADGQNRSKLQVVADTVIFLDKPKAADNDGSDEPEAEPEAGAPAGRPAVGRYRKRTA